MSGIGCRLEEVDLDSQIGKWLQVYTSVRELLGPGSADGQATKPDLAGLLSFPYFCLFAERSDTLISGHPQLAPRRQYDPNLATRTTDFSHCAVEQQSGSSWSARLGAVAINRGSNQELERQRKHAWALVLAVDVPLTR